MKRAALAGCSFQISVFKPVCLPSVRARLKGGRLRRPLRIPYRPMSVPYPCISILFLTTTRKSIHLPSFPTVLVRRILFLSKHHPMDLSSCLSGSPLSFLFILCTDCTVMSARILLHSPVLSPDLQSFFIENQSFETYLPLVFLYCSISAMIRNRTVPSCFPPCTFPVSDSDHCPVFILEIFPTD